MEEADALAAELKAAEAALKSEQAEIARDRQQLEAERATSSDELERTSAERAAVAALVSRAALALFDRVAHGRKGLAMAEARDGLCTVCHVRLRPQVFNEVRRNDRHRSSATAARGSSISCPLAPAATTAPSRAS